MTASFQRKNRISGENNNITGLWHASQLVYLGVPTDFSAFGLGISLQINPDGTLHLSANFGTENDEDEGTWTRTSNTITATTEKTGTFTILFDGDEIRYTYPEGSYIIFKRDLTPVASSASY